MLAVSVWRKWRNKFPYKFFYGKGRDKRSLSVSTYASIVLFLLGKNYLKLLFASVILLHICMFSLVYPIGIATKKFFQERNL